MTVASVISLALIVGVLMRSPSTKTTPTATPAKLIGTLTNSIPDRNQSAPDFHLFGP
jgi:hypothetical protein